MGSLHMAAIDLDALIPLIIAFFWVVAQIAGAAGKKKPAPRRTDDSRDDDAVGDPFANLMRKLGGVEEFRIPEPADEEEEPSVISNKWDPEIARRYGLGAPPIKPPRPIDEIPRPQPVPVEAVTPPPLQTALKPVEEIAEADIRPGMSAFRSGVPSVRLPSMPSMNLRIDSPSYAEASRGTQGIGSELHLQNRSALRRAMLSHIIFSPPKALDKSS